MDQNRNPRWRPSAILDPFLFLLLFSMFIFISDVIMFGAPELWWWGTLANLLIWFDLELLYLLTDGTYSAVQLVFGDISAVKLRVWLTVLMLWETLLDRYVLQHDELLCNMMEGRMVGKPARGRRRLQVLDDLSENRVMKFWREQQKIEVHGEKVLERKCQKPAVQ